MTESEKEEDRPWPRFSDLWKDDNGWLDGSEDEKYPGFRFSSEDSKQRVFRDRRGNTIVEVKKIAENGQAAFAQNTIVVLRDSDAELYWKLQWLDWWRWHGDVVMAQIFISVLIGMLLSAVGVFIGAWIFWPPSLLGWLFIVLGAFLSAAVIVSGTLLCWRFLRIVYGIIDVWVTVQKNIYKHRDKNRTYYRELFQKLSEAKDRDKARAARLMARLI